jgi:hypothetical protein
MGHGDGSLWPGGHLVGQLLEPLTEVVGRTDRAHEPGVYGVVTYRGVMLATAVAVLAASALVASFAARQYSPAGLAEERPRPPAVALPDRVIEFKVYRDPSHGYQISVPVRAIAESSDDRQRVIFRYGDEHLIRGTYEVELRVEPRLGTAKDLLFAATADALDPSPASEITADGGRIVGAARSLTIEPTARCSSRRAFVAAFLSHTQGLIVRVESDAPGLCDAERAPYTTPMIDSLRLNVP